VPLNGESKSQMGQRIQLSEFDLQKLNKYYNCQTGVDLRSGGNELIPVEPLWLSNKLAKNGKINEIKRSRVHSPAWATFFKQN
jgi:hypothetical protein